MDVADESSKWEPPLQASRLASLHSPTEVYQLGQENTFDPEVPADVAESFQRSVVSLRSL